MTTGSDARATGAGVNRRSFLRAGGLAGAGVVGAGVAGGGLVGAVGARVVDGRSATATPPSVRDEPIAFYGLHQAGVTGRLPAHLRFVSFDLVDAAPQTARAALAALLAAWTSAAAAMMAGRWIGEQGEVADGMRPAGLTVTFGLGAGAVRVAGSAPLPPLAALPAFDGDALDARRSNGDLAAIVAGNDPLVVSSAVRALVRLAAGAARPRWTQNGFSASSAASVAPDSTPRNLMGQPDGTDNPVDSRLELAVWAEQEGASSWMTGGTYLVTRRIRMLLSQWDRESITAKQRVIGRTLSTGAPLSGGAEHSTPDFTHRDARGALSIPADAHLRLTHPANNSGATMLRRSFSFDDGLRPDGEPDAGLFFQAFQSDPRAAFVPVQRRLARSDALHRFIVHEASALFAIPPGASEGGFVAQALVQS